MERLYAIFLALVSVVLLIVLAHLYRMTGGFKRNPKTGLEFLIGVGGLLILVGAVMPNLPVLLIGGIVAVIGAILVIALAKK